VVAAASFYLVERPIMYGTFWKSVKAIGPAVVATIAVVVIIVAGTAVSQNFSQTGLVPSPSAEAAVPKPFGAFTGEPLSLSAAHPAALAPSGVFTGDPVTFSLFGDSLAASLNFGLKVRSQQSYGVKIIDESVLGCDLDDIPAIADGNYNVPDTACQSWRSLWKREIARDKPEVAGLLIGRWDIADHIDNGQTVHIGEPLWDAHLYDELIDAVDILSAGGAKVVLFTMPYIRLTESPNGSPYPETTTTRVMEFNQILSKVASSRPGTVTLIDLNKILGPDGAFDPVIHGVNVRWGDGIHISEPGGVWLQPSILPLIARLEQNGRI
jgi:hypothetical protein